MCTSSKNQQENTNTAFEDFLYIGIIILNSLLIVNILAKWMKSLFSKED